jgi:hypothetical protein
MILKTSKQLGIFEYAILVGHVLNSIAILEHNRLQKQENIFESRSIAPR